MSTTRRTRMRRAAREVGAVGRSRGPGDGGETGQSKGAGLVEGAGSVSGIHDAGRMDRARREDANGGVKLDREQEREGATAGVGAGKERGDEGKTRIGGGEHWGEGADMPVLGVDAGGWARAGVEEDYYWRRLGDAPLQKDVLPATYFELHQACYEAYNANPLANHIVEMTTNFVLGNGVSVAAVDAGVQAAIDAFWNDPDNHMATRAYALCTELSLYGEQFIRFFVNPYDGRVKIAQLDPGQIDAVETDPENVERVLRVHRRALPPASVWATAAGATPSPLGAALEQDEGRWFAAPAEVLPFAINKVSNAVRGKSDLATLLPWLRRYKDWLTDRVRINKYKGAFLWTVKLTGADRKTVDRKRMEYAYPPEPGSIVVHNESEEWSAVQPHINADDAAADGRALKLMVALGAGLPEHYLAEGGQVNYATAAEMGLPTFRKFQRRQDYFALLLRAIVDRVLDEAVAAGTLPATVDRSYTVEMPPLAPEDEMGRGADAAATATALATAQDRGWIGAETARRVFHAAVGAHLDPRHT